VFETVTSFIARHVAWVEPTGQARSGRPDGKLYETQERRSGQSIGSRISLRSIRATYLDVRGWEADERPEPRSLGLLPSGPDPVGEWLAHRQPPGPYIGRGEGESKRALLAICRGHAAG
jgi:hypothetical protein